MVMAINKQLTAAQPLNLTFTNFAARGTAQVWQLTAANVITNLPGFAFTGNSFSDTLPAQSITLFVLPPGTAPYTQGGHAQPGQPV